MSSSRHAKLFMRIVGEIKRPKTGDTEKPKDRLRDRQKETEGDREGEVEYRGAGPGGRR